MAYFNETPTRQALYLESQKRWYKREAGQILDQVKVHIRADDGTKLEFYTNFPLHVMTDVLTRASSHFSKQSLLLGSSSHNELCAKLVAPVIGLDKQADLDRDELMARIGRVAEVIEMCKIGTFPETLWAQVALMAALRAISSAVV